MVDWIFDLPLWVSGLAIILSLCFFGISGLLLVRHYILPHLRIKIDDSEFSGGMLQSIMVFYGLAVALIAVSVWQSYSDVSKILSQEATSLAALYRDVSAYPEPIRSELQKELREYVHQIIHGAWPQQKQGKVPHEGVTMMYRFQARLVQFEPATEGQKILHAETLRAYNIMIIARNQRLDSVHAGLPSVMWVVILVGAVIGLCSSFFFKVEDAWLHGILVTLLAIFIGLVIFMILALDRPYRGELGLEPESYQLIYDKVMKP